MRNRLIHFYFDVDIDILWETVKNDIPNLYKQLLEIKKETDPNYTIFKE